jgi:hypothetical protein
MSVALTAAAADDDDDSKAQQLKQLNEVLLQSRLFVLQDPRIWQRGKKSETTGQALRTQKTTAGSGPERGAGIRTGDRCPV